MGARSSKAPEESAPQSLAEQIDSMSRQKEPTSKEDATKRVRMALFQYGNYNDVFAGRALNTDRRTHVESITADSKATVMFYCDPSRRYKPDFGQLVDDASFALRGAIMAHDNEFAKFLIRKLKLRDLMTNHNGSNAQIFTAIQHNNVDIVRFLLDLGIRLESDVYIGLPPLLLVAQFGNVETAEFLISRGANMNKPNSEGITPIFHAVSSNNLPMVKWFLQNGADRTSRTRRYRTLFDAVVVDESNTYKHILKLLIQYVDGATPEQIAAVRTLPSENRAVNSNGANRRIHAMAAFLRSRTPEAQAARRERARAVAVAAAVPVEAVAAVPVAPVSSVVDASGRYGTGSTPSIFSTFFRRSRRRNNNHSKRTRKVRR